MVNPECLRIRALFSILMIIFYLLSFSFVTDLFAVTFLLFFLPKSVLTSCFFKTHLYSFLSYFDLPKSRISWVFSYILLFTFMTGVFAHLHIVLAFLSLYSRVDIYFLLLSFMTDLFPDMFLILLFLTLEPNGYLDFLLLND